MDENIVKEFIHARFNIRAKIFESFEKVEVQIHCEPDEKEAVCKTFG